jgi:hypothetical protein
MRAEQFRSRERKPQAIIKIAGKLLIFIINFDLNRETNYAFLRAEAINLLRRVYCRQSNSDIASESLKVATKNIGKPLIFIIKLLSKPHE